jgi:tRNA acetyltransferase TAN1
MDANLIVTYDPTHENKAREEVEQLLEDKPTFLDSEFEGVFLLHTKEDAKKITKHLTEVCSNEPYKFKYTSRWIPVENWCAPTEEELGALVKEMNEKIGATETWKIDIVKRGSESSTSKLVGKLTEHVTRPHVDLKNPEKIIKIEIIGDRAAIALLKRDEYLSLGKQKNF